MLFLLESDSSSAAPSRQFLWQRISTFSISLGVHLGMIAAALFLGETQSRSVRVYKVLDLHKKDTVLYYSGAKMPEISPTAGPKAEAKGKVPNKPTIRTFDSNRPVPQIVWQPLPMPELPKPLASPNLAVISTPQQIAAAPPPRREVKAFKAPERLRTQAPDTPVFAEPPVVLPDPAPASAKLTVQPPPGAASRIEATAPPAPRPVSTLTGQDSGGGITAIVAGENPAAVLRDPLSGRRSGVVSAGGAPGESKPGGGVGIVVPGVAVDSPAGKAALPAVKPPTDADPPPPQIYRRSGLAAPLRPSSRNLPPAVESQFRNRVVYMCLVDRASEMFARDWVIWFAERAAGSVDTPYMRPPVPGVRPEIAPSALSGAPPAGSLYLIAAIDQEGRLAQLSSPAGSHSPWISQYIQVLSKWRFLPALRAQLPVAIDIMIEVPFAAPR